MKLLNDNELLAAFEEAFPGHDYHQESEGFGRAVERRALAKVAHLLLDALEVAELAWRDDKSEKEARVGLAFNLRCKLSEQLREQLGIETPSLQQQFEAWYEAPSKDGTEAYLDYADPLMQSAWLGYHAGSLGLPEDVAPLARQVI